MEIPILTETGVKQYLIHSLHKCNVFRIKYYNTLFNIITACCFFFGIGVLLFIKYKGKLTPEDIEEQSKQKKMYILSKIKKYQENKLKMQQQLITGLPHWE